MALSKEEINHIAKLARLGINESEKKKYAKELSGILDYMKKLNEIDAKNVDPERSREGPPRTKQDAEQVRGFVRGPQRASASYWVEPTSQIAGLANVLRKDESPHGVDVEKIKKIIGQAPEREGNFVKTKPILEK